MGWKNTNNNHCPCKGCEDRIPGCHDKCEAFREWKRNEDTLKAEAKKAQGMNTMSDAKRKAIWRKQKYARQGGRISSRIRDE